MQTWVTIVIALLTIFGSGVVSATVTYRLNAGQKEREFKRQKLEECYRAFHHFILSLSSSSILTLDAMAGKITYDQANELVIKNFKPEDKEYPLNAELLVRLYFSSLQPQLDALHKTRDELSKIRGVFKAAYQQSGPQADYREYKTKFLEVFKRLDTNENDLKSAICSLADGLQPQTRFFPDRILRLGK